MPIDTSVQIEMTPVETGDMGEIPPDLPAGEWDATVEVKATATKGNAKDPNHYPMLILELTTTASYGDGGDDFIGAKIADFVPFFPETHAASKMSKLRMKALCEGAKVETPDTSTLSDGSFESLTPFVDALEANQIHFWTEVETDKKTSEQRTKIHYVKPGQKLAPIDPDADDADEDEKPKTKAPASKAKAPAHKTNGKAAPAKRR